MTEHPEPPSASAYKVTFTVEVTYLGCYLHITTRTLSADKAGKEATPADVPAAACRTGHGASCGGDALGHETGANARKDCSGDEAGWSAVGRWGRALRRAIRAVFTPSPPPAPPPAFVGLHGPRQHERRVTTIVISAGTCRLVESRGVDALQWNVTGMDTAAATARFETARPRGEALNAQYAPDDGDGTDEWTQVVGKRVKRRPSRVVKAPTMQAPVAVRRVRTKRAAGECRQRSVHTTAKRHRRKFSK